MLEPNIECMRNCSDAQVFRNQIQLIMQNYLALFE